MAKKSNAKLWIVLHSWCALPIWFFLLFICLTGTIASVSGELLWLRYPEMRAGSAEGRNPLSADELVRRLAEQHPEAVPRYVRQTDTYFSVEISTYHPDSEVMSFFLDPYTGEIKGQDHLSYSRFQWFIRSLHGWLLTPFGKTVPFGWHVVSLLSLPMMVSLVTGMLVYKKFWRGYFKPRLRFRDGARVFWGDLHRIAGIWSLWFVLLISASSFWFLVYGLLQELKVSFPGEIPPIVEVGEGSVGNAFFEQDLARTARDVLPRLKVNLIVPGYNHYAPAMVIGRTAFPFVNAVVYIDPHNGHVLKTQTVADLHPLTATTPIMRSLHTGDFYGLWSKLVWAFFGLVLSGMILSGLMIWLRRTVQSTAKLMRLHRTSLATEAGE